MIIDNDTVVFDTTAAVNNNNYYLRWNTTDSSFLEGQFAFTIKAVDSNGNEKESDPFTVILDNKLGYPDPVQILSIIPQDGEDCIFWEKSNSDDFLNYSVYVMGNDTIIKNTEDDINITQSCHIPDSQYPYYAIAVSDIFGFTSISIEKKSDDEFPPLPVDMISVEYHGYQLMLEWEETQDYDFSQYSVLYCADPEGDFNCGINSQFVLEIITNSATTLLNMTIDPDDEYTPMPTQINSFWIETVDTINQITEGSKILSVRDGVPMQVDVLSVEYNSELLTVEWNPNTIDTDFKDYVIYRSTNEYGHNNHEKNEICRISDQSQTFCNLTDYNPSIEQWYWAGVEDLWGQVAIGSGMANLIDLPSPYREITEIYYWPLGDNTSPCDDTNLYDCFNVKWNALDENVQDFYSYKVLRSGNINAIADTLYELIDTLGTIFDRDEDSLLFDWEHPGDSIYYLWLESEDYWGLKTLSDHYKFEEMPPDISEISNVFFTVENNIPIYILNWEKNINFDFKHYKLYYSNYSYEFGDLENIEYLPFTNREDTLYNFEIASESNQVYFFQIMTEDIWGKTSYSSIQKAVPYDQVVFYSDRDGELNIYRVQLDFSIDQFLLERVADLPGNDFNPSFSPWGSKIAFYSRQNMNFEIFTINSNGFGLTNITDHPANDYNPQFNIDGTRVVFESNRSGSQQLYSMNANDGLNLMQLTSDYGNNSDFNISGYSDFGKIIYTSTVSGNMDIWLMNEDGTNKINCTETSSNEYDPDININANEIVYIKSVIIDSITGQTQVDLFWKNLNSNQELQLTDDIYIEKNPKFLPLDFQVVSNGQISFGNKVIYESNYDGTSSLWIQELPEEMENLDNFPKDVIDTFADNSSNQKNMNITRITINDNEVYRIVYESDEDGTSSIYMTSENGSIDKINLTGNLGNDYFPQIQPN